MNSRHASRRLRHPRTIARVLRTPGVLLVASIAGLVLGLTADGVTDWVAAALVSLPLLAIARSVIPGRDARTLTTTTRN